MKSKVVLAAVLCLLLSACGKVNYDKLTFVVPDTKVEEDSRPVSEVKTLVKTDEESATSEDKVAEGIVPFNYDVSSAIICPIAELENDEGLIVVKIDNKDWESWFWVSSLDARPDWLTANEECVLWNRDIAIIKANYKNDTIIAINDNTGQPIYLQLSHHIFGFEDERNVSERISDDIYYYMGEGSEAYYETKYFIGEDLQLIGTIYYEMGYDNISATILAEKIRDSLSFYKYKDGVYTNLQTGEEENLALYTSVSSIMKELYKKKYDIEISHDAYISGISMEGLKIYGVENVKGVYSVNSRLEFEYDTVYYGTRGRKYTTFSPNGTIYVMKGDDALFSISTNFSTTDVDSENLRNIEYVLNYVN